ncbi:MAG: Prephenate dehydrogenase [Alphaproteobacteria bacterium MarineAlpha3_Bin7]|nr:MAG: Prephenate dehydrogenase [Alphaproteobacteria bacterium MarineAlpha3_Bin7]|tara:strand:- start:115 stop:1008 length:894 start_codon:yes stop_codon:yes gene_type:complete
MPALFNKVTLIGIGLIGSSIARVIKRDKIARHLVAVAKSKKTIDSVLKLGIADSVTLDLSEAVNDADMVMLCSPLGTYKKIVREIGPNLKRGCILTDVGSVKGCVFEDIEIEKLLGVNLVPAHPVAGTEYSGPEAGFVELFEGRWCVITPDKTASKDSVEKICKLWEAAGSNVEIMDPNHHDQIMAMTSHLPHLISYTIVGTATDLEKSLVSEVVKYSAGGFRDFTRVAASDPTMWGDIMIKNKEAVLEILQRFNEDLTALQRAIRWDEYDLIHDFFSKTRKIRKEVIQAKQEKMYD